MKDHLEISTNTTLRLLKVLKLDHSIQIDGSLDEWQKDPCNITPEMLREVDFNPNLTLGKEDISAEGWLAWDEDALYLALKVQDDHFSLPHSTVLWDYDSLQIAIDGENDALPDETFDKNDFEFEIALLENGHIMVYATQYPEGYISSVVEEECEVAVVAG